jgi:ATP/maltotriose-dependent transcriptional regulator MalT
LIQHGRRGIAFRHEMCRLVIAGAIPPGGEVALHLRILDAMESTHTADPSAMVHHAVAGGDTARVLRYASLAGVEAARTGAHTQAASFFQTALTKGRPRTELERAELLELLAGELYLTDRLEEAIEASEQAMAIRETDGDLSGVSVNHQSLSMYEWYNAHRAFAERHASTAVEVVEPAGELVALGHAYATEAYLALQNSDFARVRRFEAQARAIAAGVDDRRLDNRLEIIAAATAISMGDLDGRQRILDVIERRTDHFDEVYSSGYSNLVYLDVEQRRLADARKILEVSLPLTVERDIPICHVWQLGIRARLGLIRGDWDAALADASEVLDGVAAPLARTWPFLVRALVSLRRGEDGFEDDLDAACELATSLAEPLRLLPAAAALAERAWLLGRHEPRLDDAPALLTRFATTEGTEWSVGDLVVWLHRLGRGDEVTDIPIVTEPHRLLLAGDAQNAAMHWAKLSAPYEQALALLDVGSEDAAITAIEILDDIGADAVAAKARLSLRERGFSVPGRRRATTRANAGGLTSRQMDVLRLLEDGLTNAELAERLFISPKTADHHVSAILSKLHARNRRDAVQKAKTLGLIS